MELKLTEKKEKTAEGTRYVQNTYVIGPYKVIEDESFYYKDGNSRRSITVVEPWPNDDFFPRIYYRDSYFGRKVSVFEVQTTSFGILNMEEFKKFIASQQTALEVIEILNRELTEKQ